MFPWNCCRTCLNTRNLYPIFIIPARSDKYTKVVHTVTGVMVKINDTMPQEMCLDCINFINESIKFRRKCEEVQTMLLENRCNSIKLEKFKPDSEDRLNAINIIDSYDDDFKDFDDNITLDTLQFHKVSNDDQVDRGKVTVNPANHFDEDNKTSEFYEASNKVCVDSNEKIKLPAEEHKFGSNNKDALNTGKHTFDTNDRFTVETFDNNETNHVDSNDVVVENNFDCKNITIDSQVKPVEYKKKRKVRVKTERKKEMKDEAVKVKEEIECEVCHKILTSKLSLRNHYKIHTGFDIVCEHCGKKFITRRLLLMHCRAKHGYEKTDKCSYCDYRASNAEQVKIHERLHTGEKPFVCKTCSAGFHRKSSYLQHVAIHLPDKTVQCDQCPARFKSVTLMRIHKNRHRPSPYTFKCGVCNNSFARRRNVARHLQRVHGLPPDDHIHRIKIH